MKAVLVYAFLTLALAVTACAQTPAQTPVPSPTASTIPGQTPTGALAPSATATMLSQGAVPTVAVSVTCNQFDLNPNASRTVTMLKNAQVLLTLCTDPTTGYRWEETPAITDPAVLAQASHELNIPTPTPNSPFIIVPAKESWTFKAVRAGTADVVMTYTRNGQPDANSRSFKLVVTVK